MKYFFASDIHGSAFYCEKMLKAFFDSKAEKLILLGDILYHGPRNDLPEEYAPKKVISMLNPIRDRIYAVRGNCEAEVDQMVLDFPVLADYAVLYLNGISFYATHGHVYNASENGKNLPPLSKNDVLIHGHTHIPVAERMTLETGEGKKREITVLNPGSVSIPKGGFPNSYAILEDRKFSIMDFEGNIIKSIEL